MQIPSYLNSPVLLSAQIGDGNTALFPVATVKNLLGATIATISLAHVGLGKYTNPWTPTVIGQYTVTVIPYKDAPHTLIDTNYDFGEDKYDITPRNTNIVLGIPQTMLSLVTAEFEQIITATVQNEYGAGINTDVPPLISITTATGSVLLPNTSMGAPISAGVYQYVFLIPQNMGVTSIRILVQTIVDLVTRVTAGSSTITADASGSVSNVDIRNIAYAVWDEVLPGRHDAVTTSGSLVQVIQVTTDNTDNELKIGPNNLQSLKDATLTQGANNIAATQTVGVKVDDVATNAAIYTTQILTETANIMAEFQPVLTAISSSESTLIIEIDQNEAAIIGQIKPQTDLIIANPATTLDTDLIRNDLLAKLSTTHFDTELGTQTSSIKGPDNRNITDVFNGQRGTDNALLATDPRLDNLDALISSRSTVTEATIWAYSPRALTTPIPVNASDVWDALTATMTTPGSIGSVLATNINATISSRSTLSLAQLNTALIPIALDATVTSGNAALITRMDLLDIEVLANNTLLNSIKPQTDLIISGVATQAQVNTQFSTTNILISDVQADVDAIKLKTDNIPSSPATQAAVLAIPINPLLDNDPRIGLLPNLINLDMPLSDIFTALPVGYALQSTLNDSTTTIRADISGLGVSIAALPQTTYFNTQFSKVDQTVTNTNLIMGAGFNPTIDSLVNISVAQSAATASDISDAVWSATTRDLTNYPAFATPADVTASQDAIITGLTQYSCMMSTSLDIDLVSQEVLAWLNVNGMTVTNTTQAVLTIYDEHGILWTATVLAPDANGVFRSVLNSSGLYQPGNTYQMKVEMTYNTKTYTTIESFTTVS